MLYAEHHNHNKLKDNSNYSGQFYFHLTRHCLNRLTSMFCTQVILQRIIVHAIIRYGVIGSKS